MFNFLSTFTINTKSSQPRRKDFYFNIGNNNNGGRRSNSLKNGNLPYATCQKSKISEHTGNATRFSVPRKGQPPSHLCHCCCLTLLAMLLEFYEMLETALYSLLVFLGLYFPIEIPTNLNFWMGLLLFFRVRLRMKN